MAQGGPEIEIARIRVRNYKSLLDPGWIELEPGFNVIVGGNNAGKTALLEALATRLSHIPHKSIQTVPREGEQPNQIVQADFDIQVSGREIEEGLLSANQVQIPSDLLDPQENDRGDIVRLLDTEDDDSYTVHARARLTSENQSLRLAGQIPVGIDLPLEASQGDSIPHMVFDKSQDGRTWVRGSKSSREPTDLARTIDKWLRDRIYLFDAERFNVGQCGTSDSLELQPDARNLAAVLHNLRSRHRVRFDKLTQYTNQIFPEVEDISTRLVGSNGQEVEVRIWHVKPGTEREDLTIPLNEAGTGLGQALGILYLLVTSTEPRPILIDEPQSFLHPGALRKLLSILHEYREEHQFILSTHAPLIISATNPDQIISLTLEDGQTQAQTISGEKSGELRGILSEIGARPSDLFGADSILWVEGATEEACFPAIMDALLDRSLRGIQVLGILSTGDFEQKDDNAVVRAFDLYRKFSLSPILIPPAIAFILDQETRAEDARRDLERRCPAPLSFLPRRMYENFLLHPEAIAHVISGQEGVDPVDSGAVDEWIAEARQEEKFLDEALEEGTRWIAHVHAGRLLAEMFPALTEETLIYRKVEHGRQLTEWLLAKKPGALKPVVAVLEQALGGSASA